MQEIMHAAGIILRYIVPLPAAAIIVRRFWKMPDELFRKLLHFTLMLVYIPVITAFETWWLSALFAVGILFFVCGLIAVVSRIPAFSAFVNERRKGEYLHSSVLALVMMIAFICICWGWLGEKYLVLACIYAWGVGDGFAALFGKRFGRHKLRLRCVDPRKTIEGSAAMFVFSALSVLGVMLARGGLTLGECILIACAGAGVSTAVEMCTKGGFDTVTCPVAAMLVIVPLVRVLGG